MKNQQQSQLFHTTWARALLVNSAHNIRSIQDSFLYKILEHNKHIKHNILTLTLFSGRHTNK